jgi:hypothetical protein
MLYLVKDQAIPRFSSQRHVWARENPLTAMARAVGFIRKVGVHQGVSKSIQMTVAITDGRLWAFDTPGRNVLLLQ